MLSHRLVRILWYRTTLMMKHIFDTWRYKGILKELNYTNFVLNNTCEDMQKHCEAFKEKFKIITNETDELLCNLIEMKVERAEMASRAIITHKNGIYCSRTTALPK